MTTKTERILQITRRFDASPEQVFEAWLDPAIANRWLFVSHGDESFSAERDVSVGGKWTITARRAGVDYTCVGKYLEIDRPHRLVFTFAMPQFSPNFDIITVEFKPDGEGCLMSFSQSGADISAELHPLQANEQGATELGWLDMFSNLIAVLKGDQAAELLLSFDLSAPAEVVFDYLVKPDLICKWLYPGEQTLYEQDFQVGGKWSVSHLTEAERHTASGVYVLIDQPHRLVYTYAMLQSLPHSDNLIFEIVPHAQGAKLLFSQIGPGITQELRDLKADAMSKSEKHWREGFERLQALLRV